MPTLEDSIKQYQINLMWINKTHDPNRNYLFPGTEEEVKTRMLLPALGWAKQNPGADVCLWYDSQTSTPEALEETQKLIQQCSADGPTVKLRDIRSLPIVAKHPDIFSNALPVYFRVDLLKLILIQNSIQQENYDASIFTDMEVCDLRPDKQRLTKDELFSDEKMEAMLSHGLLLAGHSPDVEGFGGQGVSTVENQYLQLIQHEKMLKALHYVIDLNLTNAIEFLNANHKDEQARVDHSQLLCRDIYFTTVQMHQLLTPGYPLDVKPKIKTVQTAKLGTEVRRAEFDNTFLFSPPKKSIPKPQTYNLDYIARQGNSHSVTAGDLQPFTTKRPEEESKLKLDKKLRYKIEVEIQRLEKNFTYGGKDKVSAIKEALSRIPTGHIKEELTNYNSELYKALAQERIGKFNVIKNHCANLFKEDKIQFHATSLRNVMKEMRDNETESSDTKVTPGTECK